MFWEDILKRNADKIIKGLVWEYYKKRNLDGLIKKSHTSEVGFDLILEVYLRGLMDWDETKRNDPNQYAFDRVNSFLNGGRAIVLDEDLTDVVKVPFKEPKDRAGDWGTSKPVNKYLKATPGQPNNKKGIKTIIDSSEEPETINIDTEFDAFITREF